MLVVSDIEDVFLPKPTDLLVNLAEARSTLETLLGRIPEMFQDNVIVGSAMGPALQAGFKLMVGLDSLPYLSFLWLTGIFSPPSVVKLWCSLRPCLVLALGR